MDQNQAGILQVQILKIQLRTRMTQNIRIKDWRTVKLILLHLIILERDQISMYLLKALKTQFKKKKHNHFPYLLKVYRKMMQMTKALRTKSKILNPCAHSSFLRSFHIKIASVDRKKRIWKRIRAIICKT